MSVYRNFLLSLIFLGFIMVGGGCRSFGDPLTTVKGTIKDTQNKPVSGASVVIKKNQNGEIRNATLEQITKDEGTFDFTIIGHLPENGFIVVKKDGFQPFEKVLNLEPEKPNSIEIVLESAAK